MDYGTQMPGINLRLEGANYPVTVRMPPDLIVAINAASTNASTYMRGVLEAYLDEHGWPQPTAYASLKVLARQQHRSVRGLIRNILRTELAKQGYLEYADVASPLVV